MVTIYGTENCVFCKKAIALAESYNLVYEYIDAKSNIEDFKDKFPGAKTVPQIIWNNIHLGGYNEFAEEIENTIGGYGESKC